MRPRSLPNPAVRKLVSTRVFHRAIACAFALGCMCMWVFPPTPALCDQRKALKHSRDVTQRSAPDLRVGELYALSVGISKYRDSKIPELKLSDKDAKDFAEFLKGQQQLFKKIHVKLMVNENATRAEIVRQLTYWLRLAGKDDTVVLFFSGHGSDDLYIPGEFFYLAYDSERDNLAGTAVHMSGLQFLRSLHAQRVVLIADACHAGGFSKDGRKALAPSWIRLMREFSESSGHVMITSSKADQVSLEKDEFPNSVFTHFLLKGLKGEADANKDGLVTINEVYDYAYQKTKDESRGMQHPQFESGRLVGIFPLAVAGEVKPETLAALSPHASPSVTPARKTAVLTLKTTPGMVTVYFGPNQLGISGDDGLLVLNDVEVETTHSVKLQKDGFVEKSLALIIPNSYQGKVYSHPKLELEKIPVSPPASTVSTPTGIDPSLDAVYWNRNHGFSIKYPAGWNKSSDPNFAAVFESPQSLKGFKARIEVVARKNAKESMDALRTEFRQRLSAKQAKIQVGEKQYDSVRLDDENEFKCNIPGAYYFFVTEWNAANRMWLEKVVVLFKRDNTVIEVTCTASPTDMEQLQPMFNNVLLSMAFSG